MINKILRKTSSTQKRNPYSYKERGRGKKKWRKERKEAIKEIKEDLLELIERVKKEYEKEITEIPLTWEEVFNTNHIPPNATYIVGRMPSI